MKETKQALYPKEPQSDLARKYAKHGPAIETVWRSFGCALRTKCIKIGYIDGDALLHALDTFMGNTCFIIHESNLCDFGVPNLDFLLDMLRHRATTSIYRQYCDDPFPARGATRATPSPW